MEGALLNSAGAPTDHLQGGVARTSILLMGTSFKTSSLEQRERLLRNLQRNEHTLARRSESHVLESCALVTCNRIELYVATNDPEGAEEYIRSYVLGLHKGREENLYVKRDLDAVSHIFSVASGLDSLVIGETQILQQIRDTGGKSEASGEARSILSSLFVSAFNVGRRVQASLEVAPPDTSVSAFALDFALKKLGKRPRNVLMIGTGKVARLAVKKLKGSKIYLISRRRNPLSDFPEATLVAHKNLKKLAGSMDLVISATRRPGYVLRKGDLPDSRPLVLLDLAFPRNIDPDFRTSRFIQLYDLDDLALQAGLVDSAQTLAAGEKMVMEEAAGFMRRLVANRLSPTLSSIYKWAEEVRMSEIEEAVRKLPNLSDNERSVIEAMSKSLVGKLLAPHANFVKGGGDEASQLENLRLLEKVFHPKTD